MYNASFGTLREKRIRSKVGLGSGATEHFILSPILSYLIIIIHNLADLFGIKYTRITEIIIGGI